MRSTCRRCGGRGSIITSPCVVCRGAGEAKQKKKVVIPVPAGGSGAPPRTGAGSRGHRVLVSGAQTRGGTRASLRFLLHQLSLKSAPMSCGEMEPDVTTLLLCEGLPHLLHLLSQGQCRPH